MYTLNICTCSTQWVEQELNTVIYCIDINFNRNGIELVNAYVLPSFVRKLANDYITDKVYVVYFPIKYRINTMECSLNKQAAVYDQHINRN